MFKNCAPFTDCISEINNTQVDDSQNIDLVIPMYNLIECINNYSKTLGSLWKYYTDKPTLVNNNNIIEFRADNNNSISLKLKEK